MPQLDLSQPSKTSSNRNQLHLVESLVKVAPWTSSKISATAKANWLFSISGSQAISVKTILEALFLLTSNRCTRRSSTHYQSNTNPKIYSGCLPVWYAGVTNHSFIKFIAYSMRWNPCLHCRHGHEPQIGQAMDIWKNQTLLLCSRDIAM